MPIYTKNLFIMWKKERPSIINIMKSEVGVLMKVIRINDLKGAMYWPKKVLFSLPMYED